MNLRMSLPPDSVNNCPARVSGAAIGLAPAQG
jgi:hypothetical protein